MSQKFESTITTVAVLLVFITGSNRTHTEYLVTELEVLSQETEEKKMLFL
jgi:hypothetical protein